MKIKTVTMSYDDFLKEKPAEPFRPKRPNILFRFLLMVLSLPEIIVTGFRCKKIGMDRLQKDEPCLILMNHSSFTDLKIASTVLFPRPYNIICTKDGFVGKKWLMHQLGCTPTDKFVTDTSLVKNMVYCVKNLNSSILMYPEAAYTFDGTSATLPESLGKCVKLLGVPLVTIITQGAFARDPLYNGLRLRKVKASATMKYLLSPEDIKTLSAEEINSKIKAEFSFDNFKWQQENKILIDEHFRAEGLNRVLYKCPNCKAEGRTDGKKDRLTCLSCGKEYLLTEYGFMQALKGETEFEHIPDWFKWERECVRNEILEGKYLLDLPVSIYAMNSYSHICSIGEGRLKHSTEGFELSGCEGKLLYTQKVSASYSLYSDYYWYEIGDMICIGDKKVLYYCFPLDGGDVVAKARFAAEELYKLDKEGKLHK